MIIDEKNSCIVCLILAAAGANPPSTETTTIAETIAGNPADAPAVPSSPSTSHTDDQNEQYKRM